MSQRQNYHVADIEKKILQKLPVKKSKFVWRKKTPQSAEFSKIILAWISLRFVSEED